MNEVTQALEALDKVEKQYLDYEEKNNKIKGMYIHLDTIRQALEQMQWQSIETIPPNKTVLLMGGTYRLEIKHNGQIIEIMEHTNIVEGGLWFYDPKTEEETDDIINGFSELMAGGFFKIHKKPTHWMPLPTPPSKDEE